MVHETFLFCGIVICFVADKLKDSPYGDKDCVEQIANRFDETAKKTFRGSDDACRVQFGSLSDNDPDHSIRSGKLKFSK